METNEIVVNNLPKSPIAESFRVFRTNLLYMFQGEKGKIIDITSAEPGDGKSWITANLAISFAQFGMKVLIVDADLRKGRQHRIFGKVNHTGLSDYLRGLTNNKKNHDKEQEKEEFYNLIVDTGIENLSLMPSGPVPYNPSELLGCRNLDKLLKIAKEEYDVILFDTPPVSILADSLVICKKVDYVLLVAAANKTKKELLVSSKKSIEGVGGNLVGVILNQIAPESSKDLYESYEKYSSKKAKKDENIITKNVKKLSKLVSARGKQ
ncbi:MAG: CpsD/CapB family tyrosine-protein kinase [Clostridia bacterium]|nr:CpsD/CapB family tyrosine-protein kinase [Clostridia bacterium]